MIFLYVLLKSSPFTHWKFQCQIKDFNSIFDGRVTLLCSMFQACHPKQKGPDTIKRVLATHHLWKASKIDTALYSSQVLGLPHFQRLEIPSKIFGDFQSYRSLYLIFQGRILDLAQHQRKAWSFWNFRPQGLNFVVFYHDSEWVEMLEGGDDGDVDRECPPHETRETETCDLQ